MLATDNANTNKCRTRRAHELKLELKLIEVSSFGSNISDSVIGVLSRQNQARTFTGGTHHNGGVVRACPTECYRVSHWQKGP
eukprot:scaffold26333_cov23-Phaeocystis_antarctica.AAC.2